MMWRRRTLPNGPYFSQGDQGRPREPALSGGGEDVSDEIASDGDRDVFREGFWADRGCSLHNARARQHSGWLADTPSSPALDAPQSEGTAVRARAGWSVLRRPRHPKIRARFDQLFSGFSKKPTFIPEVSTMYSPHPKHEGVKFFPELSVLRRLYLRIPARLPESIL